MSITQPVTDPGGGSLPEDIPWNFTSTGLVAGTHVGEYCGFTIRETAGSAATVILYDSVGTPTPNVTNARILEEITLAAGQSASDHYPRPARLVQNGIYAAVTGSVEGSVFQ